MQEMTKSDYELFQCLASLTQEEMLRIMIKFLSKKYKKVYSTDKYCVAIGEIPVALVAHMDTVFEVPPQEIYFDREKNVIWSPNGLGADDRAGIFSILKIINCGLRPSVILTAEEEAGCIGAFNLSFEPIEELIPNLRYLIELDRRGEKDCVFYGCGNSTFKQYICNFGFSEAQGSCSDISCLMLGWKICGVNLSVGYYNEHSFLEILRIDQTYRTIEIVKTMLSQEKIPEFSFYPNEQDLFYPIYYPTNLDEVNKRE